MIKNKGLLITGGVINILIAITHCIIPVIGPKAYIFFGAGEEWADWAKVNPIAPGALTILLALCFFIFGLYAFAGAGLIRRLPLLNLVLAGVGWVFLIRGLMVPLDVFFYLTKQPSIRFVLFSFTSLLVGFLYLSPISQSWQELKSNILNPFKKKGGN